MIALATQQFLLKDPVIKRGMSSGHQLLLAREYQHQPSEADQILA